MKSPIARTGVGRLIVTEGGDGSGKTTQARRLVDHLRSGGRSAHLTRQPSDGPVGRLLREFLIGEHAIPDGEVSSATLAALFAADRVDHLQREVYPRLTAGDVVVSDRWYHSSYGYQTSHPRDFTWIRDLNRHARRPDLTIFLRVPPEVAEERRAAAGRARELFDDLTVQRRVAELYEHAVSFLGDRGELHAVIDGSRPEDDVARDVARVADCFLAGYVVASVFYVGRSLRGDDGLKLWYPGDPEVGG